MAETVAGVTVPDTDLVRDATALVRGAVDDLLFHHSRRVFLFGALRGRGRGIGADPELLYVGAMFHDLGLTAGYGSADRRFEVDGAEAARAFLLDHGCSEADARKVWLGIALHTTPGVPEFLEPEIALVAAGVEADVLGLGLGELAPDDIGAVTGAHPRPDFKRRILAEFTHGNAHRPRTVFGTVNADVLAHYVPGFVRDDFVEAVLGSPWAE
ncbi:HD domain-containing protein [Nocardiopsis sp. NPDC101807]|uniref:HD domain-containing protein n=1 Tax=Nocardiopsis sp. NPDC101807 TaxID=3364339 RepID=UPI0037F97CE2